MEIRNKNIDEGKAFDWGRTSKDYAVYRDVYPPVFYKKIADRGLCVSGQKALDLGTGTGVIPRNMYKYGADWVGTDISENQIRQAENLARKAGMDIKFVTVPAEDIDFESDTFDVVTACQCFMYFEHKRLAPLLSDILKEHGKLIILYMAWLPFEDRIAAASEELVLKYSPNWSGAGQKRIPIWVPDIVYEYFDMEEHEEYDVMVPFTKETWHGRMRACRGVGASLSETELAKWDAEHMELLDKTAPNEFEILHYAATAVFSVK